VTQAKKALGNKSEKVWQQKGSSTLIPSQYMFFQAQQTISKRINKQKRV
jgi:hypothetical protein